MASRPSVKSLPMELVYQVCEPLSFQDILAVRFLSHRFAAVGLTRIMSTVSFVLAPTSVERLEFISQHPVWSKLVKAIEYEIDELPHCSSFPRATILKACTNYGLIASYQRTMRECPEKRREILTRILARFPNLTSLRCVNDMASRSRHSAFSLYKPTLAVPDATAWDYGIRQLEDLIDIVTQNYQDKSRGRVSLKSLGLDLIPWPFFEKLSKCESMTQNYDIALQHVTSLDLRIRYGDFRLIQEGMEVADVRATTPSVSEKPLVAFLRKAPKLESLRLHFKPESVLWAWDHDGFSDLCIKKDFMIIHAIGPLAWSNLRHFKLTSIKTKSRYLMQLLHRHAQTLKSLSLHRAVLLDGQWADIVDEVCESMNLEELCFRGGMFATGDACTMTNVAVRLTKDGNFVISLPKAKCQDVRFVLDNNRLSRILFPRREDADDELPRCMEWWARRPAKKWRRMIRNDARLPTLHIQ